MALLMYFSYTTLSTVGFGDLTPRSDNERLLCIMILFLGVIIFGLILNNFQQIIKRFHTLDDDFQDEDSLNMFFDSIKKRYNQGIDMDLNLKEHIERYFQYRWQHDRNIAIQTTEEINLLEQLPDETVIMLYKDYLFYDFLREFRYVFKF